MTPDESIIVPLNHGKVALIDAVDAERVLPHRWFTFLLHKTWYAASVINGNRIFLHRFIMDAKPGDEIDHRDRDGLNNRRSNLRFCTHSQNIANARKRSDNTCGYRGIFRQSGSQGWCARIECRKQRFNLGTYPTMEEAARAYDAAARQLFGEFAYTNFNGNDAHVALPIQHRLSPRDMADIRVRRAAGERPRDLALEFGVHRNTIYRLKG